MLMHHIPDKHKYLVHCYGYYSKRSQEARTLVENGNEPAGPIRIARPPGGNRRKANWARLIRKVYEVDPLECVNCGAAMRIIAIIDDAGVVERILEHLSVRDPQPESRSPDGHDPPVPKGENISLS